MSAERVTRTWRIDAETPSPEQTTAGRVYRNVKSARVGPQVYSDGRGKPFRELRPLREVGAPEALASMAGAPYKFDHNGDPTPRGKVVNPRMVGEYVEHEIEVPAEHVDAVEAAPRGLSWEYTCELAPPDPVLADVYGPHDAVQTNIRATALAAVQFPRCGASCARTKSDSADCTCGGACTQPATENKEKAPMATSTSTAPSDTSDSTVNETQDADPVQPDPAAMKEEIEIRAKALHVLGENRADHVMTAPLDQLMEEVIKERDSGAPLARLDSKGMTPEAAHAFRLALFHRAMTATPEVTPTARAMGGERMDKRADASAYEPGMTAWNTDAMPSTTAAQANRRLHERTFGGPRKGDDTRADGVDHADAAIARKYGWPPGMTARNTAAYPSPNFAIAKQRHDARLFGKAK